LLSGVTGVQADPSTVAPA